MKRTKIITSAIAIVVVAVLADTVAAHFTGKRFEELNARIVNSINLRFSNNPLLTRQDIVQRFGHLQVSTKNYQRGLYSSQYQTVLTSSKNPQQPLFVLNSTVQHGPFTLNGLAQLNFLPAITEQITPAKNEGKINKILTELAQGKDFFTYNGRTHFFNLGQTSATINIAPLHFEQYNQQVDFSGGIMEINDNRDTEKLLSLQHFYEVWEVPGSSTVSLKANKILITHGNHSVTTINGISYDSQFSTENNTLGYAIKLAFKDFQHKAKQEQFNFTDGVTEFSGNINGLESIKNTMTIDPITQPGSIKVSLTANKIAYNENSQPVVTIDNISSIHQSSNNNKTIDSDITLSFKNLVAKTQPIGDGELSAQIKNIDKASLTDYRQFFKEHQRTEKTTYNPMAAIAAAMENADLTLGPVNLRNDKGLMSYTFSSSLRNASTLAEPELRQNPLPVIKNVVKSLDSKLQLSKAATAKLVGQINCISDNSSCEQAATAAVNQVNMLDIMGQLYNLTTTKDDNIISDIHIKDGMVTVNGKTMPLEQFINSLSSPLPDILR